MSGAASERPRVASVDVARGVVMVLMAVDHVRVYAGVPAGGPEPGVFFTRRITHFCAPAFVFLAGASVFLHRERAGTDGLARWLLTRGALLIGLELTLVRLAWTFNLGFDRYLLAGVLWMIGWCLILMVPLVRLPSGALAAFGIAVIAGHHLIERVSEPAVEAALAGGAGWLLRILYFGGPVGEHPTLWVLYSLVPWIGVMAAGCAFGRVLRWTPERRSRACLGIGAAAVALFVLLRALELYGDQPWRANDWLPSWLSFLNTSKYPASLQFLLMTLGPLIAALPLLERASGPIGRVLTTFGRVPFGFYLLHIPLIHLLALVLAFVRSPAAVGWLFHDHPLRPGRAPDGYVWSLGLLYAVTALAVALLYPPCAWLAREKARRRHAWLAYL
ncbi:MAG: heparan-alpha-glucosaminide N-acetyltransferase domain-containing protein [Vicinamibacteria bacterium]